MYLPANFLHDWKNELRMIRSYGQMERIAKQVPKPCYALEFDLNSDICQACEVQTKCFQALGARREKITLDKINFKLVPAKYGLHDIDTGEDPELPAVERTYIVCHRTIFGRPPRDKIGQHKFLVVKRCREAKCALRLFMLTNMIAHQQREITIADKMHREPVNYFNAVLLTQNQSIDRLNQYRDMCRKTFGSFDLGSLDALTKENYAENDIEKKMLHSEVTASRVFVSHKIRNGGDAFGHLYHREEITLDPHWLATESSYLETVLKPHMEGAKGTKMVNNHRFSVVQVIAEMKRRKDWAIAVFQARERIMPKAMQTTLHFFGFKPTDFEIDPDPITSTMDFWIYAARAIQHVHCIRYMEGDYSIFKT